MMKLIPVVFALLMLCSQVISSTTPQTVSRHVWNHNHVIRCQHCFCGHRAFQQARHHCAGDRELVRCVDSNRVCYRCNCHRRNVSSPRMGEEGFLEDEHHHDDHEASHTPTPLPSPYPREVNAPRRCGTLREGGPGVSIFSTDLRRQSGALVLRYTTDEKFSRFAVLYAGDISYEMPTQHSGTLHIRYSGASSVMRLWISASSHWQILIVCPR